MFCYHDTAFWCDYITWISSILSKWNRLYLEYSTVNWRIDSIQFSTFWHTTGIQLRVDTVVAIHSDLLTQSRNIPMGQFCANIFLVSIKYFELHNYGSDKFSKIRVKSQLFSSAKKTKLPQMEIMSYFSCKDHFVFMIYFCQFSVKYFSENGP